MSVAWQIAGICCDLAMAAAEVLSDTANVAFELSSVDDTGVYRDADVRRRVYAGRVDGSKHPTPGSTPKERPAAHDFYQNLGVDFTGMTVASAQGAAFTAGWHGLYEIRDDAIASNCAVDTVCSFEPRDWKFHGDLPALVFHVVATPSQ